VHVTAIIAAGGRGQRLGGACPKQLLVVGGRAVLERSVAAFAAHPAIHDIIVALPSELAADPPAYLGTMPKPLRIVVGGLRRQDSVANAVRVITDRVDLVVIHDAARPFVSAALIERTIAAAAEAGAAVAALPARDTVKRGRPLSADGLMPTSSGGEGWVVDATLPRESIFLAQTPQAFRRDVLLDALTFSDAIGDATDEAALAERAGHRVRLVEGEMTNIKITTPEDLPLAEAIALGADRLGGTVRVGIGYDLHRLVDGRPLILGGVAIPFERGLLGHSDADAVCHAVIDAVLGAAAAGDIGRHFPDADPQWRGASSLDLLRQAVAVVHAAGFAILNVDVVVIAEQPRLGPHVAAMCAKVAASLGIDPERVSIKGKTNEGVGALGRGEAIAAHAVALVSGPGRGTVHRS
jgi:2-C-methyl-D-erythritol 4-phosphate cytidylyltransferase/2-C-methyl-D-erythritol 2,4-cyclodiphosphate synthase